MRRFTKPALTVAEQVQLLRDRNLIIKDPERTARYLEVISFFRLSAYMRPFQIASSPDHTFKPDTEFRQVVGLYAFDRELRMLIMDAIERFEVAVRAAICNHMGPRYGAHWYLKRSMFRRNYDHSRLLKEQEEKIRKEQQSLNKDIRHISNSSNTDHYQTKHRIESRKKENYLRFYSSEYDEPELLPGWAMAEELSFGSLSHLYKGIAKDADKKKIAARFEIPHEVLGSWLHTLTFVRNCCAHHSRLWNRELSVPPTIPKKEPWASIPDKAADSTIKPTRRIFIVLAILNYLMVQVSPESEWRSRLHSTLNNYPEINSSMMGFPDNWQNYLPT